MPRALTCWQSWGIDAGPSESITRRLVGGKSTKAHMPGSRVMSQSQGKTDSGRPAQSVPVFILQPTAVLEMLERQTRLHRAGFWRPWRATQDVWWDATAGLGGRELCALIHVLHTPLWLPCGNEVVKRQVEVGLVLCGPKATTGGPWQSFLHWAPTMSGDTPHQREIPWDS